jgi:hypothetical protein
LSAWPNPGRSNATARMNVPASMRRACQSKREPGFPWTKTTASRLSRGPAWMTGAATPSTRIPRALTNIGSTVAIVVAPEPGGVVSRAAKSLFIFGIYLELLAIALVVVPNALLAAFNVASTREVWIRCLGVVTGCIGVYYLLAARGDFAPIIVASVPVRLALTAFFAGFVAFDHADPSLLFFGLADAVGAVWTLLALRADAGLVRPGV